MSNKSMSDVINAIKERAASEASSAGARDLVYLAKSVESLYGADTLVSLMEKAGSPATVKSLSDNTQSVELSVADVERAVVVIKQDNDNASSMKRVYSLANISEDASFSVEIDGIGFSYNAVSGDTEDAVNAALRDLINNDETWGTAGKRRTVVASVESSSDNLAIESICEGVAGSFSITVTASGGSPEATIIEVQADSVDGVDRTFGSSTVVVKVPKYGFSTVIQNKTAAKLLVRHAEDSNSSGIEVSAASDNVNRMVEFIMCDGVDAVTKIIDVGSVASPTSSKGDLEYHDGTQLNRLPVGTAGYSLQSDGNANLVWKSSGGSDASAKLMKRQVPIVHASTAAGVTPSQNGIDPMDNRVLPLDRMYYCGMKNSYSQNHGAVDYSTFFGIDENQHLFGWGNTTSYHGAHGNSVTYRRFTPCYDTQSDGEPEGKPIYVLDTYNEIFVLHDNGEVWSAGENTYGQLGLGHTTNQYLLRKINFPSGTSIQKIVSTNETTTTQTMMALDTDGFVWTWGYNNIGQVGDGSTIQRNSPYKLTIYDNTKDIWAGGGSRGCLFLLRETGSGVQQLYGWGHNVNGQLSIGSTTNKSSPQNITIPTGKSLKTIVISGYATSDNITSGTRTFFQMTDGSLYASGHNGSGELGDSTTSQKTTMVQCTGWNGASPANRCIHLASSMSTNASVYASAEDGTFYAWGENTGGQLGIGSTTATITQRTDTGLRWAVQFVTSASGNGTSSVTNVLCRTTGYNSGDYVVYTMGYNGHGQRGLGHATADTSFTSPTKPASPYKGWGSDIREIGQIGWSTSIQSWYMTDAGELFSSGYNGRYGGGAGGFDNTTNYYTPRQWQGKWA